MFHSSNRASTETPFDVKPIGVGFSYGATVNNSADAAKEMYDFLQKFYTYVKFLYPS